MKDVIERMEAVEKRMDTLAERIEQNRDMVLDISQQCNRIDALVQQTRKDLKNVLQHHITDATIVVDENGDWSLV